MTSGSPGGGRLAWLLMSTCVLLLVAMGAASAENVTATPPFSIGSGRLFTTDGWEIGFSSLSITPDSARYEALKSGGPQLMLASNVLRVEKQAGNEAGKWAAIMGLSALAGSLLGVAQAESSDLSGTGTSISSGAKTAIVAGMTGLCTIIGAAIGSGHKTYVTVYENPAYKK